MTTEKYPDSTLHLPRILCLHGGGTTAEIFRLQSRSLLRALAPRFRLIFADAPFLCDPGPGIIPVYQNHGPFRRWLRWLPEHPEVDAETVISEIQYQIDAAVREDKGTGPVVGLMGFSQGAKLAASLLYEQQIRVDMLGMAATEYKFAVLLAGRTPLMKMSGLAEEKNSMLSCDEVSEGFIYNGPADAVLELPTIHVHGLKDAGLHLHRRMLEQYCGPKNRYLVEWDGDHRVPLKKTDVDRIVDLIVKVADQEGI